MPQLSLYIDEDTLKAIELAAKAERTSLSKWVVARLRKSMRGSWPANYEALFGALRDPTFDVTPEDGLLADARREEL